ncbi:hypothetical protein MTO96_013154 [Rhipicephalus appendiculatus]
MLATCARGKKYPLGISSSAPIGTRASVCVARTAGSKERAAPACPVSWLNKYRAKRSWGVGTRETERRTHGDAAALLARVPGKPIPAAAVELRVARGSLTSIPGC